jgi:YD repeat-containing protein
MALRAFATALWAAIPAGLCIVALALFPSGGVAAVSVTLYAPETVHSNGAELQWSRFDTSTGTFDKYEVHRSSAANFTPTASTLLTSISAIDVTSYRDTTAAASQAFSYKIVVAGAISTEQRVTLPSTGEARKVLQPGPAAGKATYLHAIGEGAPIESSASLASAEAEPPPGPPSGTGNAGDSTIIKVGFTSSSNTADSFQRGLLRFELGDMPSTATVKDAKLSLYSTGNRPALLAHMVTSSWEEDQVSWNARLAGLPWRSRGGDVGGGASTSVGAVSGAGWHVLNVTSLVAEWVHGTTPNHGIRLRIPNEGQFRLNVTGNFHSDDYTVDPSLRPKLELTYTDGSKPRGPTVDVTSPAPGATVRGTAVPLVASASDDRRVDRVDFFVDGNLVRTDLAAPWTGNWNSETVPNGQHTVTAKATDDVGHTTTSSPVTVSVQNSAAPTAKVTSPSSNYPDMVKADGAEGYWRLGEATGTTAADSSGRGRTGTYSGAFLLGQPSLLTGSPDTAAKLQNGTTDGQVSAGGLGALLTTKLTAEAWVDYTGVPTLDAHTYVASRSWGGSAGWVLSVYRHSSGAQRALFSVKHGGAQYPASAAVTPGKLYLAGTYDGQTVRLYVNGAQVASATTANATFGQTALDIGKTLDTDITVDEVAVHDAALTANQIRAHYDAGKGQSPTLKGTASLAADASDDVGLDRVEFLVDGLKVGEDTTAPYRVNWATLDPALPFYDGPHTLTAKAYDTHGQATESAAQPIVVANGEGSRFQATLSSTAFPQAVVFSPGAPSQTQYGIDVTVTNKSAQTWTAGNVVIRPRWLSPDTPPTVTAGTDVSLGQTMAPNQSVTKTVLVQAPSLPAGVDQAEYDLQLDLVELSTSTRFADQGNKPLEQPVTVHKAIDLGLGLERYYQYDGEELGAGMTHLVNVASGNSIMRWTPFESPGRGLSTVLDLTYNALEQKSESPIGNNWSLSVSSLTRFGNPLDVHPNKADDIAGRSNRFIEFTDGDGTTHRFIGKQATDGTVYWEEPAGVHLFLREYSATDAARKWALTRPDRVTFFYDQEGFPTFVRDGNGNELKFTLQVTPPGEDPGGPKKRITEITDAAGLGTAPAPNRKFRIDYFSKAEAKKAHVRGKVERITDHNGSALDFDYYDDGNLLRLTQRGGLNADGSFLADRSFVFTYTTSSGDGPAIPGAANRVNPDPKTSNQSTRLYSVRDPRGSETPFTYLGPGSGNDRWKLGSRVDRSGATTTYTYNTAALTTVTTPLGRATKYAFDGEGKVTSITNPESEETKLGWSADRHVSRVTEPNGNFLQFDYNANGYPTRQVDQLGNVTTVDYENLQVKDAAGNPDTRDSAGKWRAGRNIPHLSQLDKQTAPEGVATASPTDDFQWLFDYDTRGNLTKVTHPEAGETDYAYDVQGRLTSITDANDNPPTQLRAYDANGLPGEIVDGQGRTTKLFYDDDGHLRSLQDPVHANATGADPREYRIFFDYDSFHRLARQSAPKSTALRRGTLIWSGVTYDENDNVRFQQGPHESGLTDGGGGAITETRFDAMDRPTLAIGSDKSVDPQGERARAVYDDAGRLVELTNPRGMHAGGTGNLGKSVLEYDKADRLLRVKSFLGAQPVIAHHCYDRAGDLISTTSPRAQLATVDCASTTTRFTTRYSYDAGHRLLATVDPQNRRVSRTYDRNGNVRTVTDARGNAKTIEYDERDLPVKIVDPLTTTRAATTKLVYDKVGNLTRQISPRAWDASSDKQTFTDFVTSYTYDAVNQLTKIELPSQAGQWPKHYIHRTYDPNGRLATSSLPVENATSAPANQKTTVEYFDTGWIERMDDPAHRNPFRFDYSPEGWQELRVPVDRTTKQDIAGRKFTWDYFADGILKERRDGQDTVATYVYDANNNLTRADDSSGLTADAQKPVHILAKFDELDRMREVSQQKEGENTTRFSSYNYDVDSNLSLRIDNQVRDGAGQVTDQGRKNTFVYDDAGWLTRYVDHGRDSADTATGDDRQLQIAYFPNGLEQTRTIRKRDAADQFTVLKQRTTRDYFQNGWPTTLSTENGQGAVLESHAYSYEDSAGRLVNGHRTKDVFSLKGPAASAPCRTADCTRTWAYDARDRLVEERRVGGGADRTLTYGLLPNGSIDWERRNLPGQPETFLNYEYDGTRLTKLSVGEPPTFSQLYFYDANGNLNCVTEAGGTAADCLNAEGQTPSPRLLIDYHHDYLDRLEVFRSWKVDGTADRHTIYERDALDRIVEEQEQQGSGRVTRFTHLALSNLVTREERFTGTQATGQPNLTKTFSYDASGRRVSMTDEPQGGPVRDLTFAHDVQGSVSLLLNDAGQAQAQYGYSAYGDREDDLTFETMPDGATKLPNDERNPLNPFRYTGKRGDAGAGMSSGSGLPTGADTGRIIDMGARQFGPDVRTFLQEDLYAGAAMDLGLSLDPLTNNRLALAGGNPVSFVEVDGHYATTSDQHSENIQLPGGETFNRVSGTFTSGSRVGQGPGSSGWEPQSSQQFSAGVARERQRVWNVRHFHEAPVGPISHERAEAWLSGFERVHDISIGGLERSMYVRALMQGDWDDIVEHLGPNPIADDVAVGIEAASALTPIGLARQCIRRCVSIAAGRSAAGSADDAARAVQEGIYVIRTKRGRYVGQSGDIPGRLAQWVRSGRFSQAEVDAAERIAVSGGRTKREIAEQLKIDELGGVDELLNIRNPIGRSRLELMPEGYTRP